MSTYIFPGQGSQNKEMSADLFNDFPDLIVKADRILGYSIAQALFEKAGDTIANCTARPYAKCGPGRMLAILHPPRFYDDNGWLRECSELAAINFHSHFVVSGETHHLMNIETYLIQQQMNFQALAVNHGFHSSLINAAAPEFLNFINSYTLQNPRVRFMSCANSDFLVHPSSAHFWDIIRLPIQFQKTLEALEKKRNYHYIDVGPSGTLATFVKYNLHPTSSSQTFSILTPFGQDIKNLETLLDAVTS